MKRAQNAPHQNKVARPTANSTKEENSTRNNREIRDAPCGQPPAILRQQITDNMPVNIGQPAVHAVVTEGQFFVINPQQV